MLDKVKADLAKAGKSVSDHQLEQAAEGARGRGAQAGDGRVSERAGPDRDRAAPRGASRRRGHPRPRAAAGRGERPARARADALRRLGEGRSLQRLLTRPAIPRAALVLIAAISVLWGLNWPIMKVAVGELSPWTFRSRLRGDQRRWACWPSPACAGRAADACRARIGGRLLRGRRLQRHRLAPVLRVQPRPHGRRPRCDRRLHDAGLGRAVRRLVPGGAPERAAGWPRCRWACWASRS